MSEQRSFFDEDEAETGLARVAELREVLAGTRAPAPSPDDMRAAREDAIEAIADVSAGWRNDVALPFIEVYLRYHSTLFVDDLWSAGLPEPHDRKALGPALREAARRGWMVQTDQWRVSASNSNRKPVWKSLLCGGDE